MRRKFSMHAFAATMFAIVSVVAAAQPTTFRITQLFSNLDGSLQFVELTESEGLDGQHQLAGLMLKSTHKGVVKQFTIPIDLSTEKTAHMSIVISSSSQIPLAPSNWIGPDISGLPPRFIPTDGGTLEFAGVDRITYAAPPTDGVTALYRDGDVRHATVPSNGRCPTFIAPSTAPMLPCEPRFDVAQSKVLAVEYYHAALDHYFLSASAADIDALDSGLLPGWKRTGEMFHVGGGRDAVRGVEQPVCRFYVPPSEGDSHFFSASTDECELTRARFPGFILESNAAFYAALPDPLTGSCGYADWPTYWPAWPYVGPAFLLPVYRLWNGRADANHRYTADVRVRDKMIEGGYVSEGYGPNGVAMCVLQFTPWDYY